MELDDLRDSLNRLDRQMEAQKALTLAGFRRQAGDRIGLSLRPLARSQIWMILFGLLTTWLGLATWQGDGQTPDGVLASGLTLMAYGLAMVLFGVGLTLLIGRINPAGPVLVVQRRLSRLRKLYIQAGIVLGLPWFMLWAPALVGLFWVLLGVDLTARAPDLWMSFVVGGVAAMVAVGLTYALARLAGWRGLVRAFDRAFTGAPLLRAQAELDEMVQFDGG